MGMFDKEKAELYNLSCGNVRGLILSVAVKVEFLISKKLNDYFAKDEVKADFHRYIMSDTMTFEQKKYAFASLIKRDKIIIKDKYKSFISDLDYIQNLRNKMAHSNLYIKPEIVNNFNGDFIYFMAFSKKDEGVILKINLKEDFEENEKENLYSIINFVNRSNKFIDIVRA